MPIVEDGDKLDDQSNTQRGQTNHFAHELGKDAHPKEMLSEDVLQTHLGSQLLEAQVAFLFEMAILLTNDLSSP